MSNTEKNLKDAFAGESQACMKYTAYAYKAEKEGLPEIAKLFRAAADAERRHAMNHWKTLGNVKSTLDNLKDALAGETFEVEDMYPKFLKQAQEEDNTPAQKSITGAFEAEKVHMSLFSNAIKTLEEQANQTPTKYYTCSVCGYTHAGDVPPEKCPVCNVPSNLFEEVM